MDSNYALWAIASGLFALAAVWFVKTPKQAAQELEVRIKSAEDKHNELHIEFIESRAEFKAGIRELAGAVDRLSGNVRELSSSIRSNNDGA